MPAKALPDMMFRSSASETPSPFVPIRVPGAPFETSIPWVPFGRAAVPLTSVPMKLPATALSPVWDPSIQMPKPRLPEMILPSASSWFPSPSVPIQLSCAPALIRTPWALPSAAVPAWAMPI